MSPRSGCRGQPSAHPDPSGRPRPVRGGLGRGRSGDRGPGVRRARRSLLGAERDRRPGRHGVGGDRARPPDPAGAARHGPGHPAVRGPGQPEFGRCVPGPAAPRLLERDRPGLATGGGHDPRPRHGVLLRPRDGRRPVGAGRVRGRGRGARVGGVVVAGAAGGRCREGDRGALGGRGGRGDGLTDSPGCSLGRPPGCPGTTPGLSLIGNGRIP
ncbi:hypothetical protein LSPH24S_07701 [Lysinibacillus sphaericus]